MPPADGLATVRFVCTKNRVAQAGYICRARLDKNTAMSQDLLLAVVDQAVSGSNGIADLALVQSNRILHGNPEYFLWVEDADGNAVSSFRAAIPNNTSLVYAAELMPV